jgi:hypothetical protein
MEMKKIIKGITYDTDTATEIGWGEINILRGKYFLWGEGGEMTCFRGGYDIIPLTCEEARRFAEEWFIYEAEAIGEFPELVNDPYGQMQEWEKLNVLWHET